MPILSNETYTIQNYAAKIQCSDCGTVLALDNDCIVSDVQNDAMMKKMMEDAFNDPEVGFDPYCPTCCCRVDFSIELEYQGAEEVEEDLPF